MAKLLSGTRDIGICLFSTLESHFATAVDGHKFFTENNSFSEEQSKLLCEGLSCMISSVILYDEPTTEEEHLRSTQYDCKNKVAGKLQISRYHLSFVVLFFILTLGYLICFPHVMLF